MAEARIDVAWRFVQKHALRAQVFGVVDRLSVVLTERGRHIQLYHVLMIFSYRQLQRTHQPRHLDYSSRLRSWAAEEEETWSVADAPLLIVGGMRVVDLIFAMARCQQFGKFVYLLKLARHLNAGPFISSTKQ